MDTIRTIPAYLSLPIPSGLRHEGQHMEIITPSWIELLYWMFIQLCHIKSTLDFFSLFAIKQKVCTNKHGTFTGLGRRWSTNMAAKLRGFRTTQMSRKYGTKQMGFTVYVQINTKGAELRQAMATSRQHPAPLIVDPRISKLPGGILTSDWREELHFWHMNIKHKLYLENMYRGRWSFQHSFIPWKPTNISQSST